MKIKMKITKYLILMMMTLILAQVSSAQLQLDSINYDPAIIAAGDEVSVVLQYHEDELAIDYDKIKNGVGNSDYTFKVSLEKDDSLTQKYTIIQDSVGDNLHGSVYLGDKYNKVFKIKVLNNAPAGNYQFKLVGQWYKNGVAIDEQRISRFYMPVKKEGIIMGVASLTTNPPEVRPGDNFVQINTKIENSGEKDSKAIEVTLKTPEGFKPSYSDNNRKWVGIINAGESETTNFYVDISDDVKEGKYDFDYVISYRDLDDNSYNKTISVPFLIKSHPNFEITNVEGVGTIGKTTKLKMTIKNIGEESAESVDIRLLKQNSQPFDFDVRSDYIGELEPGEEGVAIFDVKVRPEANIKDYDFKLLIRAKGDTDKGDDRIYTYNRRAKFDVTGTATNWFLIIGIIGSVLVLLFLITKVRKK